MRTWFHIASLGVLIFTAAPSVHAAHPSLEACGGLSANRTEGVRVSRLFSRRQERVIEDFLQRADATPGVAVAIVKDDRVIYARGFGYRDLADCKQVTSQTRFYLKSTTKSFLGVAAAILHEEGAIELDAPISDYLPNLRFPDGLTPKQASIRSHLTHTNPTFSPGLSYRTAFSGNLPEEGFVEFLNEYSRPKDIRFRYSNVGPIMAAHAIGRKTGTNWRDFIRVKVFEPAGMNNSFTVMAKAEQGPMATGYTGAYDTDFVPTLTKVDSQMHAAGGSVSTAADLARWVILNLNGGRIDGAQALPARAVEQAQARQAQLKAEFLEYRRFAYGLGLYFADYEGDLLVHHFGGETHMSFMPEHGLGVAVLTNELAFGVRVTHHLASTIYDMLLKKGDLSERIDRRVEEISSAKAKIAERLTQYMEKIRKDAPQGDPTFAQADLAGDYVSPRLGKISIAVGEDGLSMAFGALKGPLRNLGGDAYLAEFGLWGEPPVMFLFRKKNGSGLVLDWGGRIFERRG